MEQDRAARIIENREQKRPVDPEQLLVGRCVQACGHCDERGSEEYNLALGDARSKQAKQYLAGLGLPDNQLREVSYGKDRPVCTEHDEACWQKNRRAHITQEGQ